MDRTDGVGRRIMNQNRDAVGGSHCQQDTAPISDNGIGFIVGKIILNDMNGRPMDLANANRTEVSTSDGPLKPIKVFIDTGLVASYSQIHAVERGLTDTASSR